MTQTRVPTRALVGASAFAALVAFAIGCAYLGGSMTRSARVRADAARFATAAPYRYSDRAVIEAAGGLDPAALDLARRHDLASLRAGLRPITDNHGPAAAPYRADNASKVGRDIDCLSQAIYFEARGEGAEGMKAVAQVILNRVRHPAFPKSVCGVVYQGVAEGACQFSFACEGRHAAPADAAWAEARTIAGRALAGHVMAEVGNATHFHATRVAPDWRDSLLKVVQIGSHIFYRFGAPGASRPTPVDASAKAKDVLQPVQAGLLPGFDLAALGPDGKPAQPIAYQLLQRVLPGPDKPAPLEAKPAPAKASSPLAAATRTPTDLATGPTQTAQP